VFGQAVSSAAFSGMSSRRRIVSAPPCSVWFIWMGFLLLLISAGRAGGVRFELRIVGSAGKAERVLYSLPTEPGRTFTIRFTHSLDKCPVVEYFRIEGDGTVTLMEHVYGWFGAGLEFNPETGFRDMKDHMVHIKDIGRNLADIPIRVGWMSGFRLEYENQVIPLNSLAPPGRLLIIKIHRTREHVR